MGWWHREELRYSYHLYFSWEYASIGGFDVLRPVLTASRPSQTIAQMGPLSMSERGTHQLRGPAVAFLGTIYMLTGDKALVEWFVGQVLVMLLEVLLRRADKLHGCELISGTHVSYNRLPCCAPRPFDLPTPLESGDDVANKPTLAGEGLVSVLNVLMVLEWLTIVDQKQLAYLNAIWLDSNESIDNC